MYGSYFLESWLENWSEKLGFSLNLKTSKVQLFGFLFVKFITMYMSFFISNFNRGYFSLL